MDITGALRQTNVLSMAVVDTNAPHSSNLIYFVPMKKYFHGNKTQLSISFEECGAEKNGRKMGEKIGLLYIFNMAGMVWYILQIV